MGRDQEYGQGPGKGVGSDVGKQDSGISVSAVPFQSPGEAVRDLQLCEVLETPGPCTPGVTRVCFQFLFQDS